MQPAIHRRMDARDWAQLLFLSVLWGGSFFFIGVAVKGFPPLVIVALRATIACAALWSFVLVTGTSVPRAARAWLALAGMAVLNNAVPFSLFAWAQSHIPAGLAAILNATTPLFGVLVAHAFTRDEKLTPARAFGVLAGFAGVAVMLGVTLAASAGVDLLAEGACLLASLLYACSGVYGRRFRAMGLSPLATATGQLTLASVMLVPVAMAVTPPWTLAAPPLSAWLAVAALGLASTGLAYVVYFRILASAGATNLMLVTFLLPVTAILLGIAFLDERLEPRHIAGMALIAVGLAAIDGRPWAAVKRAVRGPGKGAPAGR